MPAIEESAVFEFCEKLYNDLQIEDGGYYPSKHDDVVFLQAAEKFNIPIEGVNKIYSSYSKHAADIEMDKINKLPPILRKKVIQNRTRDIILNNKDLPFFKIEGSPSEQLLTALEVLTDEYRSLVESVANLGWTIPLSIDICRFQELKTFIGNQTELDEFFVDYYSGRELRAICRKIRNSFEDDGKRAIFEECIKAYESNMYTVCLTTLISILDVYISGYGDDPKDVRVMRICKFHADNEMVKKNNIKSLCWLSMYEFTRVVFEKSDFSQSEPNTINRHWIQHGRTGKIGEQIDCIKIFNALSTLVIVKQNDNS